MSSKVDRTYPFDLYVGKVIDNTNYKESKIMCEQIKSVSKKRLSESKISVLPPWVISQSRNQGEKGASLWG
jgi:mRNA-degrading endonuclease toxin of MazEF toxin-antitoxin module